MRLIFLTLFLYLVTTVYSQEFSQTMGKKNVNPRETGIAVNPLLASQAVSVNAGNNIYYSSDSGKTWKAAKVLSPLGFGGEPQVYCTGKGIFYYLHLSVTSGKNGHAANDRIIVHHSTDGGKTWSQGVEVGYNNGLVLKTAAVHSDESAFGRYKGRLYITWTEFSEYGSSAHENTSRVLCSYSDDGIIFSKPAVVSHIKGKAADDNTTLKASTATGSYGQVYSIWSGDENLYFSSSYDGGKTFAPQQQVGKQHGGWNLKLKHLSGISNVPSIACDLSKGPNRGTLYVAFADTRNGPSDIWLLVSSDMGYSWKEIQVNERIKNDPGDCFSPNIKVNPANGKIAIAYYQRDSSNFFITPRLSVLNYAAGTIKNGEAVHHTLEKLPFASPGSAVPFTAYLGLTPFADDFMASWTSFENSILQPKVNTRSLKDPKPLIAVVGYNEEIKGFVVYVPGKVAKIEAAFQLEKFMYSRELLSEKGWDNYGFTVIPEAGFVPGLYTVTVKTPLGRFKQKILVP